MSKKTKALMDDYEPVTEKGRIAKEQLIRLCSRRPINILPRNFCLYTSEQIIKMWRETKNNQVNDNQEIKYEVKIQSEKANA